MPNAAVLGRNLRPARSSLQGTQLERYGNDRGSAMCPLFPRSSVSNRGQLKWHVMCLAEEKGNGAASGRLKTTKVKFLLQRECMFGEQYKVTGGDPVLGEWDPNAAVPLEWSEGHNWTAELEVPHGKKYKYKFLLFCKSGEIQWQPGPDRVFSTSQKPSSMVVSQPWDFDGTCPEVGHTEAVVIEDAPMEIEETEKEQGPEIEETEKEQGLLEPKNFEPQNIDPEAKSDDSTRASEEVASVSNTEEEILVAENHSDVSINGGHDADLNEVAVSNMEEEILVAENHSDVFLSGGHDADSSEVAVSNNEEEISVDEIHSDVCISGGQVKIEVESIAAEDQSDVCVSGGQDAGFTEAVEPLKTETLLGYADVVQDTTEVQTFKNDAQSDVNDVSITVWRKDRAWIRKVLSALSALFRR